MYSARNSSASSSSRTSSTTPESWSTWQPRLKRGTLGAYDEALSFVRSHSESLRSRMSMLESDHAELSASERAQLKESLEIASLINLPWIVSAFERRSVSDEAMRRGYVHKPYFLLGQVCHNLIVPSSLPLAASSPSGE